MSGSKSSRGAALFNNPTSSSNSDFMDLSPSLGSVLTEISKLPSFSSLLLGALKALVRTSSEGPDGSFRCCR
uniref:Uncharacterized protein n=1 Tax=Panthera tigris altaica TaxID=74533 RepID=A0A8C9JZG3_PANTA